jgi:hypothetical protein
MAEVRGQRAKAKGLELGPAATRFHDLVPFEPARRQQEFDATALGRFAEDSVSGCQQELLAHRQFQLRGITGILARRSL